MSTTNKQDVAVGGSETEKTLPAVAGSPFAELERNFERLLRRNWLRPFNWEWPFPEMAAPGLELRLPAVDVIDQPEHVVVRAELPGVDKKNVDVSVTENSLTIKAKARSETKEQKGDYHRCEISQSAFSRTVALPSSVDPAQVKAKLQDGILEVTLNKADGSRRHAVTVE